MPIRSYGRKDKIPPQPLSFDRVNQGRSPQSNSLLFQLPFEILGQILQHVEPASMPSQALVNRDCRLLAHSRQFASIQLHCDKLKDLELIELLMAEDVERDADDTTLSPSLGVCTRRITVLESRSFRHPEQRDRRLVRAYRFFTEVFLPPVQHILSSRRLLPHLEELVWKGGNAVPRSFFNVLINSSIQHLKLYDVSIEQDFTMNVSTVLALSWPLRTFHLELKSNTAPLSASLLYLCASTLESLTWIDRSHEGGHSFVTAGLNPAPCFTRLRRLFLDHKATLDSSLMDALILDNIRTLAIQTDLNSVNAKYFHNRGSIPSLRRFELSAWNKEYTDPTIHFLTANPHLSKLSLNGHFAASSFETQLLPLLSSSFSELTSLSLPISISESALKIIASLKLLQQIYLRDRYDSGWRQSFHIIHKATRKHLQELVFLKKIAINLDNYPDGTERFLLGWCPEDTFLADRDPEEQKHRELMLAEANEYLHVMPQLEWLYIGHISIGFRELPGSQERVAVVLHSKRWDSWALLRSTFKVEEDSA